MSVYGNVYGGSDGSTEAEVTLSFRRAEGGAPVAGAAYSIKSTEVITGTADENGDAEVSLPTGGYTVKAQAEGVRCDAAVIDVDESGQDFTILGDTTPIAPLAPARAQSVNLSISPVSPPPQFQFAHRCRVTILRGHYASVSYSYDGPRYDYRSPFDVNKSVTLHITWSGGDRAVTAAVKLVRTTA